MLGDGDTAVFTVRSRRMVLAEGVTDAAVHVDGGRIVAVTDHGDTVGEIHDLGDHVVLPGLVDPHVHVNEPGRADWEGFETATRAAAAGGTTTIVDMPLNCIPPTTTADHLRAKVEVARGRLAVDVALWGGIVPDNGPDLDGLLRAGVAGCKAFLIDSGVEEFPPVDAARLREAMPQLRDAGIPLLVHAELEGPLQEAQRTFETADPSDRRRHDAYVASRPAVAEAAAVALVLELVAETGTHAHILHLSAATAVPLIARAQADGLPVTAETCPHYLTLASEDVPDGATEFKCAPPIRDRANQAALWAALRDGTIGMIASDHSPCTPELKAAGEGDFGSAWGGIASLQLRLPLVWTAARSRDVDLPTVARWLSTAPAQLAGLGAKGAIEVGRDADLVVFDPEATWTVEPERLQHRHPISPYAGRELEGRILATYLRGRRIVDDDGIDGGHGRLLLREDRR